MRLLIILDGVEEFATESHRTHSGGIKFLVRDRATGEKLADLAFSQNMANRAIDSGMVGLGDNGVQGFTLEQILDALTSGRE